MAPGFSCPTPITRTFDSDPDPELASPLTVCIPPSQYPSAPSAISAGDSPIRPRRPLVVTQ
ncbi:MAG: hypothetical protein ACOX52_17760 [Verrucomicrobiota bacterium]